MMLIGAGVSFWLPPPLLFELELADTSSTPDSLLVIEEELVVVVESAPAAVPRIV